MGSALSKTPDSCLAPSTMSPCEDAGEVCNPEEGPYLTMLAARSQTSSIQNCEKLISAIYKPPNYGVLLDVIRHLHTCTAYMPAHSHMYSYLHTHTIRSLP